MASKTIPRALRLSSRVAVPRRTFTSAVRARPTVAPVAAVRSPVTVPARGVKTIDFAGTKEDVYGEHCRFRPVLFQTNLNRACRLASREAPGILQGRNPCSHRLRLPGPRSGP